MKTKYELRKPKSIKNNWFNRTFRRKSLIGDIFINDYKRMKAMNNDVMKFHLELTRMEYLNELPNCIPKRRPQYIRINTIIFQYALAYLDIMKEAKKNPEMTLKQYIEL